MTSSSVSPGPPPRAPALQLALGLVGAYFLFAIISYPSWWLHVIRTWDTSALWEEATGPYLSWNVGATVVVAVAVWCLQSSRENAPGVYQAIVGFLNSNRFLYVLSAILAIALARVFLSVQQMSSYEAIDAITRLTSTVESLDVPKTRSSKLPKVIDILYVNAPKIEEFYGQIVPQLALKEKSIAKTRLDESTGSVGLKDALSAQSRGQDTVAATETYTQKARTISEKVVSILDELKSGGELTQIKTLEIDSKKLADFDSSVNLLEKEYGFVLPASQVGTARRQIVEESVKTKTSETFAPNSWVVIEGTFRISRAPSSVGVTFDYVPSLPGRIAISSVIPETLIGLQMSPVEREVTISGFLFGKIDHAENQDASVVYSVNTYALFR